MIILASAAVGAKADPGWSRGDKLDLAVAGGTLILAVATLLLAWFTRSSVKEAGEARRTWESMAADAARTRMDASAPVVELSWNTTRPYRLGSTIVDGITKAVLGETASDPDYQWTVPKDDSEMIRIGINVVIANKGERRVWLSYSGVTGRIPVEPGEQYSFRLEVVKSLAHFRELFEYSTRDSKGDYIVPPFLYEDVKGYGQAWTVAVRDDGDQGVSDTWEVFLAGVPVVNVVGDAGAWKWNPASLATQTYCKVSDRRRDYYLSRRQGAMLGDSPRRKRPRVARRLEWVSEWRAKRHDAKLSAQLTGLLTPLSREKVHMGREDWS